MFSIVALFPDGTTVTVSPRLTVVYVVLHAAAGRGFARFGLATDIVIGLGLAGLAASTIVISAVTIRRRRAAAGACHACSHLCRGAMVPLPERDARRWPHRPLNYLPGGRPPVPPAVWAGGADRKNRDLISPASPDEKRRTQLPLTVILPQPERTLLASAPNGP